MVRAAEEAGMSEPSKLSAGMVVQHKLRPGVRMIILRPWDPILGGWWCRWWSAESGFTQQCFAEVELEEWAPEAQG